MYPIGRLGGCHREDITTKKWRYTCVWRVVFVVTEFSNKELVKFSCARAFYKSVNYCISGISQDTYL